MDIRDARTKLRSYVSTKKLEYEAAMKVDQALAHYEGLESRVKQMDSDDQKFTAQLADKKTQLSALDYKLEKKIKEVEGKISKAENDGAEKLDDAHKRYGLAEREIISDFRRKKVLYENELEELDASIKTKSETLAKMEKSIDKHKKEFGSLVASA